MADINSVTVAGRLTRDAELKYTNSGMAIMTMSVAVNTRKKDGDNWVDEANFFDITMFGKTAEAINSYLTKGNQVAVTGRLKQDRWEQDGQSRSKVGILADNIMLLGSKGNSGNSHEETRTPMAPANTSKPKVAPRIVKTDDFEDDIPF